MLNRITCLLLVICWHTSFAGDIPGMPLVLPPSSTGNHWASWSNDFLGRGGESDDHRTQQLGLGLSISPRWAFVLDHSILTLRNDRVSPPSTGGVHGIRLDQLSASLGYRFFHSPNSSDTIDALIAGAGVRSYGNFSGQKMQDGFHRLVGAHIQYFDYLDTRRTNAVIWLRASRERLQPLPSSRNAAWRAGYWLDASGLYSSDQQADAILSISGVLRTAELYGWLGLRADWRHNYYLDALTHAVAESESGVAISLGLRIGPMTMETVQGLGDQDSWGRVVFHSQHLPSGPATRYTSPQHTLALNLLFPGVEAQLRYGYFLHRLRTIAGAPQLWLTADIQGGKPAIEGTICCYRQVRQAGAGAELAWRDSTAGQQAWPYINVSVAQREEQLRIDNGMYAGQQSQTVDSTVLQLEAGYRMHIYRNRTLQIDFQAAVIGQLSTSTQEVQAASQHATLNESRFIITSGLSIGFGI